MADSLSTSLTNVDQNRHFFAISYAYHQLKDHEKNYSLLLLLLTAAVWGMDIFNKYLKKQEMHPIYRP